MSTIIQCPSCATRYRLKFAIEDGQQVRCPSCKTVWRFQSEAEEEQPLFDEPEQPAAPASAAYAAASDEPAAPSFEEPSRFGQAEETEEDFATAYDSAEAAQPSSDQSYAHEAETYGFENDEGAEVAAETESPQPSWAGSVAEDDAEDRYEGSAVNYIRGSALAPFPPAVDDATPAGEDWAAELAGAINRAGFEPRAQSYQTDSDDEALQQAASSFDEAQAADDRSSESARYDKAPQNGQDEDDNQRIAAERLSAFWRGERAVASYEENEFKGFGGGMPVRQAEAEDAASSRGGLALAAAWGSYIAVAGGLMASIVLFPEHVVEAMPGAAVYYERVGVSVAGDRLGFENVTYEWLKRGDKSVLEVRGDVVNLTSVTVNVPVLHIHVRDDQSVELAKTDAFVVKEPLEPAAKTAFTLEFISPPKNISGVELKFGS